MSDTFPPLPASATPRLNAALSKAQGAMGLALKDSTNPHFGSKFADLASCRDVAQKPLADNGLAWNHEVSSDVAKGEVTVTFVLMHESGEEKRQSLTLPVVQKTPQGFGSSLTYGRRYTLCAGVGIASEDDDGNAGSGKTETKAPKKEAKPEPKPESKSAETAAFDREVARKKLIAAFAAINVNAADLTRRLGHSPDVISDKEWVDLRQWHKDLTVDVEEQARQQVIAQAEQALSLQGPAPTGTPAKVFEGLVDKIRAAKTEAEAIQVGAAFGEAEKVLTPGDMKALRRAYADRILILQDAAKQKNGRLKDEPQEKDLPF